MGIAVVVAMAQAGEPTDWAWATPLLPVLNLFGTVVALVGIGYAAIAGHRREWGVVLVLAWISSVVAVLSEVQPFSYVVL